MRPGDGIEIVKDGITVARSRNLDGINRYARNQPVCLVTLTKHGGNDTRYGEGVLTVEFYDGAVSHFRFADFEVARDWIKARRSWGVPIMLPVYADGNMIYCQYIY